MLKKIFFLLAIFVSGSFLFSIDIANGCSFGGSCKSSCSDNEEQVMSDDTCGANVCCITKTEPIFGGSGNSLNNCAGKDDNTYCDYIKDGTKYMGACWSGVCGPVKVGEDTNRSMDASSNNNVVVKKEGESCSSTTECKYGLECGGGLFGIGKKCKISESTAGPYPDNSSSGTGSVAPVAPISGGTYQPSTQMTGGWNLNDISKFGLPKASISGIAGNLLDWLLGILAVAGVIGFVISGIIYAISTGDESAVERAKTAMKWSIVGVVVGLSGVVIVQAVDWALNGFGGF